MVPQILQEERDNRPVLGDILEKVIALLSEQEEGKLSFLLKMSAFLRKQSRMMASYRWWYLTDFVLDLLMVVVYFYVSKVVDSSTIEKVGYGSSFFGFAFLGIILQQYVYAGVNNMVNIFRNEIEAGTLEVLFTFKTPNVTLVIGEALFQFILATVFFLTALIFGLVVLDVRMTFQVFSIGSAVVIMVLMIVSHVLIGIASVGMVIKHKQGDLMMPLFSWMNRLVAGVLYPLNLLPSWLAPVGLLLPLTHSLDGIRRCLLPVEAATLLSSPVLNDTIFLVVFIIVFFPVSLYVLKWGCTSVKKDGSLAFY